MIRLSNLHICRHLLSCHKRSLTSIPACTGSKGYCTASWENSSSPSSISVSLNKWTAPSISHQYLNPTKRNSRLLYSQPKRAFLSQVSHTGFNDYEIGRKEFKLEVPENFNFANVLDEWAQKERVGDRTERIPALWWIDDDGNEIKWSFQDLENQSKKVANILEQHCGVKQGDVVMVILPRVPEWWLMNIACLRTGAIMIPGTTMLTARDIEERVQASKTSVIITDDKIAPHVDKVAENCQTLSSKLLVSQSGASRDGWENYMNLFDIACETHICADTKSSDAVQVYFTSGTTGKPKMAEHTHASYGLGHTITGKYWLDLTSLDVHWTMSDTGWAKAAWGNFFAPWTQGACIFVHNAAKFDVIKTLEILQKYPITTFCGPPTAYRMMVQEDLSKYDLKSIRHTLSAGEPLNPEVVEDWKRRTGCLIREGYGQTETTLLVGSFLCIKHCSGSMGKPAPGYDIHIIDGEGKEVGVDQEGYIAVKVKPERPVGLFTKYVNDPQRTAASFIGDYYLTGDKATMDSDGYLWFVARGDDVITSAGYRIGPFEVESALIEHPAVAESAVVSSPDSVRGEVVKAFIVLTKDYQDHDQTELTTQLQEHVKHITAPYKYPRKIDFVESLPKTISGKIRRVELRNREWEGHA
ncbi:acyl-coenzyme A synthetase ACSM3, mitochondrial-like isoform X2 [Amphiura filiformis]|uniref:acyl-coenzyme A synthetase ACSM3, mitochondrial-like isoform X2 n=1 Tax=Amphiura filiformis TaxID=82378 RepID=UPI003B215070